MNKVNTISFWKKHKDLVAAFSTKAIGNVSFRTGDSQTIQKSRESLVGELGIKWNNMFILPLSHSNRVLSLPRGSMITKNSSGVYVSGGHMFSSQTKLVHDNLEWQSGIDAVVSDMRGIFPIVMSADCAAIGLFDSRKSVFALIHAGLIGAVNRIVVDTVQCMVEHYNSDSKDIEVVIFPSIRSCHYDLQKSGAWKRIKADSLAYYGKSESAFFGKRFDLQGLIGSQLVTSGLIKENIHDVNLCTVCNLDAFFSNLAAGSQENKKKEGRFASIMGIRDEK